GNSSVYLLEKGKAFKTGNLERIELSDQFVTPHFSIHAGEEQFEIECFVKPDAVPFGLNENEVDSSLIFMYNHQMYLWADNEAIENAEEYLPDGIKKIKAEDWPQTLAKVVMPLARQYKVDFDRSIVSEIKDGEPEAKLVLHEKGEYLVFQPIFNY